MFPKSAPARFGCKQRKACNNTSVGYGGAVSTRSGGTPVHTVRAELACLSLSAARSGALLLKGPSSTECWFPCRSKGLGWLALERVLFLGSIINEYTLQYGSWYSLEITPQLMVVILPHKLFKSTYPHCCTAVRRASVWIDIRLLLVLKFFFSVQLSHSAGMRFTEGVDQSGLSLLFLIPLYSTSEWMTG